MSYQRGNLKHRTPWQIQVDVVFALIIRELKTRFGTSRLGYFWALAEPMAQASVLAAIFSIIGRSSISNIPIAMFLLVAILPFKLFSKLLPQLTAAIASNKGLMGYRQVTAIDPILSRIIIELVTYLIVYVLLMLIMGWMGFSIIPADFLLLLLVSVLTAIMSIGLGLALCVATIYWKEIGKLVAMIMQPMFFISGIFFCALMIPQQYWFLFSWNPLFHMTELSRDAYFTSYVTPVGDIKYLALCAFGCFAVGIMSFAINRTRFVSP